MQVCFLTGTDKETLPFLMAPLKEAFPYFTAITITCIAVHYPLGDRVLAMIDPWPDTLIPVGPVSLV